MRRCRYADCREQNSVAGEDEQVTCETCRAWMGLPRLEHLGDLIVESLGRQGQWYMLKISFPVTDFLRPDEEPLYSHGAILRFRPEDLWTIAPHAEFPCANLDFRRKT